MITWLSCNYLRAFLLVSLFFPSFFSSAYTITEELHETNIASLHHSKYLYLFLGVNSLWLLSRHENLIPAFRDDTPNPDLSSFEPETSWEKLLASVQALIDDLENDPQADELLEERRLEEDLIVTGLFSGLTNSSTTRVDLVNTTETLWVQGINSCPKDVPSGTDNNSQESYSEESDDSSVTNDEAEIQSEKIDVPDDELKVVDIQQEDSLKHVFTYFRQHKFDSGTDLSFLLRGGFAATTRFHGDTPAGKVDYVIKCPYFPRRWPEMCCKDKETWVLGNKEGSWAEIRRLKTLQHPRIIRLLAYSVINLPDVSAECFLTIMPFKGKHLTLMLNKDTYPTIEKSRFSIAHQVLEGLHYIHEKGFYWGDLKAGNILLDTDSMEITLIDFASCREKWIIGNFSGSYGWMAPEVASAFPAMYPDLPKTEPYHVTQASDIYSLGILLAGLTGIEFGDPDMAYAFKARVANHENLLKALICFGGPKDASAFANMNYSDIKSSNEYPSPYAIQNLPCTNDFLLLMAALATRQERQNRPNTSRLLKSFETYEEKLTAPPASKKQKRTADNE